MSTNKRWLTPLVLVSWLVLCIEPAPACSVPVFRYALERWTASPYTLLMFHRGPLTPGDKALVDLVTKSSIDGGGKANVFIQTIDVSAEMDEFTKAVWENESNADLPLSVLRYPSKGMGDPGRVAWRGRLTKPLVELMLDSPARREIAKRITTGDSAVWVFLRRASSAGPVESSPPRANWLVAGPAIAAALVLLALVVWSIVSRRYIVCGAALVLLIAGLAVLQVHQDRLTIEATAAPASAPDPDVTAFEATLKKAEGNAELSEMDPNDRQWDSSGSSIKELQKTLKLKFSVLPVRRADPREKMFVRFLMGSEPDLETEHAGKPMAFPVFGRGRVLCAIVGDGMTEANIGEACRFLAGPCSCTIKDLNPGVDMLMTADWGLGGQQPMVREASLPPLPALSQDIPPANAPATPPAAAVESAPPPSQPTTLAAKAKSNVARQAVILGAVVVLITIALAVYARKSSSGTQA